VSSDGSFASRIFDQFLLTLILLNVAAVVAASVQSLGSLYASWFRGFEAFSVAVFSVEYALRV